MEPNINDGSKSISVLSSQMYKMFESIKTEIKSSTQSVQLILEPLVQHLQSKSNKIVLLSCEVLVKLYDEVGAVELQHVMFILKNELAQPSCGAKYRIICEALTNVCVLEIKKRVRSLGGNCSKYSSPQEHDHPLNELLSENNKNTVGISDTIYALLYHYDHDIRNCSMVFLKPFLVKLLKEHHLLTERKLVWTLILEQLSNDSPHALNVCIEILSNIESDNKPKFWLGILRQTIEHFILSKNWDLLPSLVLLFVTQLHPLIEQQYDSREYATFLADLLQRRRSLLDNFEEPILLAIVRLLPIIPPAMQLNHWIKIILTLLTKHNCGSFISCHWILESMIQFIANPGFMQAKTAVEIEYVIDFVQTRKYRDKTLKAIDTSSLNRKIYCSSPGLVQLIHFSNFVIKMHNEPNELSTFCLNFQKLPEFMFCDFLIGIVKGLILSPECKGTDLEALLHVFVKLIPVHSIQTSSFLMPLLYKLTQEVDPLNQIILFRFIPAFAQVRENIPTILTIIRRFERVAFLDTVCLDLYFKLWQVDYRTYSYLSKHLNYLITRKKSEDTSIVIISIIKQICEIKPSENGRDLVNAISVLINDFSGSRNGLVSCLALDAIRVLCECRTIDLVSTWKVLKPKFNSENRVNVIVKLCEFFSVIPELYPTGHESIAEEALAILWDNIQNSNNKEIMSASFKALALFPVLTWKLMQMPEMFRRNIKLPKSHLSEVSDEEHLLNFPYVPGECWIEMLKSLPPLALDSASSFISFLIDLELKSFRGGVFVLLEGRKEPTSLVGVPPKCVLKAMLDHLVVQSKTFEKELISMFVLKSISLDFGIPLPPLDWSFLAEIYRYNIETRQDCVGLAVNQVEVSKTALAFVSEVILNLEFTQPHYETVGTLISKIESLSKRMPINEVEIFFRNVLECLKHKNSAFLKLINSLKISCLNPDLLLILKDFIKKIYIDTDLESEEFELISTVLFKFDKSFLMELTSLSSSCTDKIQVQKSLKIRLANTTSTRQLKLEDLLDIFSVICENQLNRQFALEIIQSTLKSIEAPEEIKILWTKDTAKRFRDCPNACKTFMFELFSMSVVLFSKMNFITDKTAISSWNDWPESLQMLSQQILWKDNIRQVIVYIRQGYHNLEPGSLISVEIENSCIVL